MEKKTTIPHIPFYFARHGETDWNKQNKVMGQIDVPLNEIGIAQAKVIAQQFVHLDIAHIVSGPLQRTMQTSEIIAMATNTPITIIEELKNASAGIREGQDRGDGKWLNEWRMGIHVEGSEPWHEFVSRVSIALITSLAHTIDKKPVLIVAHGPTYWALLQILNAVVIEAKVKNCGVYFFSPPDLDSDQWSVKMLSEKN